MEIITGRLRICVYAIRSEVRRIDGPTPLIFLEYELTSLRLIPEQRQLLRK